MTGTEDRTGSLREWVVPFVFLLCAGWVIWHGPAYILEFIPPDSSSLVDQMSELHTRKDITPNWPPVFGDYVDPIDWLALILLPVVIYIGSRTVRCARMEFAHWRPVDRIALFIGRATMMMIASMTLVMLFEVFMRYAMERPTLWANELTLWIAGFVFLCSGIYAMQQRCHIRIFLLYDLVPRALQRVCDVVSVCCWVLFAFFLVFGSFKQVFVVKFYKWETFGTAFDPPIPSTIQPMILITVTLMALQAVVNLIADWNLAPATHGTADKIDEEELEAIKRTVEEN